VSKKHSQVKVRAGQPSAILDLIIFQISTHNSESIQRIFIPLTVLESLINFLKDCFETTMAYLMDSKSEQSKILVKNAYFHSLEPQNRKIYRIKRNIQFYIQKSSVLLFFLLAKYGNHCFIQFCSTNFTKEQI
jgi:hypothetical protein